LRRAVQGSVGAVVMAVGITRDLGERMTTMQCVALVFGIVFVLVAVLAFFGFTARPPATSAV
jgi:hypothetical protein